MSLQKLKKLNEDDEELDEFVEDLPKIRDLSAAIDDVIEWVQKTGCEYF